MKKRILLPVLLVASVFLCDLALSSCATGGPQTVTSRPLVTQRVWETFYAARDNDPPFSRAISYPGNPPRHTQATADLGTYTHPITLAADKRWLPVGTIVYAPRWRKYYVMEDQCVPCEADWAKARLHHIDLYISDSIELAVLEAEDQGTKAQAENDIIILDPPSNLAVDTTPLYTDARGSVIAKHQYGDTLVCAPAPYRLYWVMEGDTLSKLAQRFDTPVARLMDLNHFTSQSGISEGQLLRVGAGAC